MRFGGKTVTGEVLFYWPPMLYHGDTQMVTAKSAEELYAMIQEVSKKDAATLLPPKNVIIFSRSKETDRPIQTMLLGA